MFGQNLPMGSLKKCFTLFDGIVDKTCYIYLMTMKQPPYRVRTNACLKMKRLERAPPTNVASRAVTAPFAQMVGWWSASTRQRHLAITLIARECFGYSQLGVSARQSWKKALFCHVFPQLKLVFLETVTDLPLLKSSFTCQRQIGPQGGDAPPGIMVDRPRLCFWLPSRQGVEGYFRTFVPV